MISFLEKQRIYFSIFTNGIWKNPDELVKKLSTKQYFRGLLISFHGDSLESNRVFNPYLSKEDFKKIKSNIIFSSDKIKTHINCVLNKINKDQMESLYEFKIKNKISGITYSRYIGNQKELKITPEELKKAVCRINGFPENEKMLLGNVVPQCFIKNSSGCQAGVNYCAIRTDAKVLPCSHSRKILGDIIKESIENIWEKKKRKDWINKFTNKKCHKCKYMMICQGGCKAEAELNKKNFDPLFQDAQ